METNFTKDAYFSRRRRLPRRRPVADRVEAASVEVARDNQTDGYRMVTAFVRRKLGVPVNRKRVLRVMRARKLIQRRRPWSAASGPASSGSSGRGSCGSST
jgi:HTH-like domain